MKAQYPVNEAQRLKVLHDYAILDTPAEPEFDALTALAANLCQTPVSTITLVDGTRQWFKSKVGLAVDHIPRAAKICAYALENEGLLLVPDTLKDSRFSNNPLVLNEPKIRFYAGTPLITPEGETLGTLCVVDWVPRELTESQKHILTVLGEHVMTRLQLRRQQRQQERTEIALQESEERWQFALLGSDLGVWDWNAETDEVYYSDLWCSMLGYAQAEIGNRLEEWSSRLHPEDRAATLALVQKHFEGATPHYVSEHRLRAKDGSYRWILDRGKVVSRNAQGHPLRVVGTHTDITEHKRAEQALRASEATLATAQRIAQFGSWEMDLTPIGNEELRTLKWSDEVFRMAGFSLGEVQPTNQLFFSLVPEEDHEPIRLAVAKAIQEKMPYSIVHRFRRADGQMRILYETAQVSYDEKTGCPTKMVGIVQDITERQQAEDKIRRLNRLYAVSSSINQAIVRLQSTQELYEQACRIAAELGGLRMAWVGMVNIDGTRLDVRARHGHDAGFLDSVDRTIIGDDVLCGGLSTQAFHEDRIVYSNDLAHEAGTKPWHQEALRRGYRSCAAFPLRIGGKISGVYTVYGDHAECFQEEELALLGALASNISFAIEARMQEEHRLQAETSLQETQRSFHEMAENIGEIFYNYDVIQKRLLYTNQAYAQLWGRSCESVYADPLSYLKYIHPEDLPFAEKAFELQLAGQATNVEFRVTRPDGSQCWVHEHGVPVLDESGRVERIVGTMRDITERKLADEQIRESEERFRMLSKATNDAIWDWNLQTNMIWWNEGFETLFGYQRDQIDPTIQSWYDRIHPEEKEATIASIHHAIDSGEESWTAEYRFRRQDEQYADVMDRGHIIYDTQGKAIRMIGGMTDQSDRKKLEQQFLRAQRMESIGTLAGGISHDLNNVLAPIMMSIELLQMDETDSRRLSILSTIEASARRGSEMVKQVLSFARGVEGQHLDLEIGSLLHEVEKIANETFFKSITVETDFPNELWQVQGDPTQLHQVLINLCVNARDAMPQGGKLMLSACNQRMDEHYAAMNLDATPGPYVVIQVEDTGVGMTPQILERIFEPFFTTKELGKGTGLGLSTTQAIIKSHGGFIRVYSEVGMGTRFRVYLPALDHSAGIEDAEERVELPRGQGELILVVDDEASVRNITTQTLEAFGYKVITAADGAEATALFAVQKQNIAAVITDMMMPVMDGPSTIPVLIRMNPQVRIIAASGLNANGMVAKAMSAGIRHFLPKPYTADTLLKMLKKVLEEPLSPPLS
ncbi:PAS domain-containing protein [Prosthecobacter dejongeii]|uniref:histidine kinase n=1 Tax=Prosthecobacter dejongeii TaxID=48465 RepID=A0A7W8DRI6_9BACT|nr:PAS domain-containing protein [Prosthecobacter dejongeii]MBB5039320.1 PAS domain S-box-containing protein [Prosthecobacter dejongeii]